MNHLRPLTIAFLLLTLEITGCDRENGPSPAHTTPSIKLTIHADGSVFLDGKPASLAEIDDRLAALAKEKGEVRYHRESPQSEPPPVAMQVMDLVVKHSLPISMSSKSDFSDVIDDEASHTRGGDGGDS